MTRKTTHIRLPERYRRIRDVNWILGLLSPAIPQSRAHRSTGICCLVPLKDALETHAAGLADAGKVEQHYSVALFGNLVFKELHDLIPARQQAIDFHAEEQLGPWTAPILVDR